jgi:hypothetical protein
MCGPYTLDQLQSVPLDPWTQQGYLDSSLRRIPVWSGPSDPAIYAACQPQTAPVQTTPPPVITPPTQPISTPPVNGTTPPPPPPECPPCPPTPILPPPCPPPIVNCNCPSCNTPITVKVHPRIEVNIRGRKRKKIAEVKCPEHAEVLSDGSWRVRVELKFYPNLADAVCKTLGDLDASWGEEDIEDKPESDLPPFRYEKNQYLNLIFQPIQEAPDVFGAEPIAESRNGEGINPHFIGD